MLVASDPFERQDRLLSFTWLMLRVLASYALADYVCDPPGRRSRKGSNPENLLQRLTRPSDGDWQSIGFHALKAIAAQRQPFMPELWEWLQETGAEDQTNERRLNQLVHARNQIRHGASSPSEAGVALSVEQYEAELRQVLGSMDWMTSYRLVRVSRSENLSTPGAFKGSFHFFGGSDDAPERVDAKWRGWFQKGQLYLLSADASRALNLSPFINVQATAKNSLERVFVVHKVAKSGALLAFDDRTAEEAEFRPSQDDHALGFTDWLALRPLQRCVADLADVDGKLAAAASPAWRGGAMVDGKYRVHEVLGQGAMGTVYRAHHAILERDYALKIIHEGLADDPVLAERFRREARLMSEIDSPYVLGARDVGALPDGRMYIASDLVGGGTVSDLIEAGGREPRLVARIVHDAAQGLMALHAAGAVHRDIKPENLLVRRSGQVVVADMGIARAEDDATLTATLERIGSRAYMAPEVLQGAPASPASDVYSLGVVAAELLRGARPTLSAERREEEGLGGVIQTMLALSPEARPSLPSLLDALGAHSRAVVPSEGALERSTDDDDPVLQGRWTRKHGAWVAAGVLGVLVAGALAMTQRERPAEPAPSGLLGAFQAEEGVAEAGVGAEAPSSVPSSVPNEAQVEAAAVPPAGVDGSGAAASGDACCRICWAGKACGNTCIALGQECHQEPGCACDS